MGVRVIHLEGTGDEAGGKNENSDHDEVAVFV